MRDSSPHLEAILATLTALVGVIETRAVHGAVGLALKGTVFAVISGGKLYFRADSGNRADYEGHDGKAGAEESFFPGGAHSAGLNWCEVPAALLGDSERLRDTALRAWDAGKRAAKAAGP